VNAAPNLGSTLVSSTSEADRMQAFPEKTLNPEMPLELLLFIDKRPSSRDQIWRLRDHLQQLQTEYPFDLQVVDVGEQPYLAEHYKLIATPALIKIYPEPRHLIAGSDIIAQLNHWWPQWLQSARENLANQGLGLVADGNGSKTDAEVNAGNRTTPIDAANELAETSTVTTTAELPSAPSIIRPTEPSMGSRSLSSILRSAELIRLSDDVFRLKKEKEELEHQLQFKDQIIAMLAHDLRNPLTAASIALETLEMGHDATIGWSAKLTPALTAQLLKHARTQIRAIDRMITDILQAARGANSEFSIQPQKLDLGSLCLDVLESLQDRFQEKGQTVEQDIPSDLPMVLADGERVRQVIVNLLDNAIKYTPVGGLISVTILHRTTQKVQVSICDNGPGIPEEKRERIFEDRYRLKRDAEKEGYGIGLSLCQRIIRAHYGQIWVDSSPNRGSCFHFTLPVFRQ
jgi:two-component system clock-associated histidine kinase SasA